MQQLNLHFLKKDPLHHSYSSFERGIQDLGTCGDTDIYLYIFSGFKLKIFWIQSLVVDIGTNWRDLSVLKDK